MCMYIYICMYVCMYVCMYASLYGVSDSFQDHFCITACMAIYRGNDLAYANAC
jgi:hypothetical protein